MEPNEQRIRELMSAVACSTCGGYYDPDEIEVLGRRDTLWFLRVSCARCATSGLVAAVIRPPAAEAQPEPAPAAPRLDEPRVPGPVTAAHVDAMHEFLRTFDGDFRSLFAADQHPWSGRSAA